MTDEGRVLYARRNEHWVLRFEGAVRYTMAHAADAFLDELFAREAPESVCVDLNPALSIDSTGVGLLVKVARGLKRAGKPRPVVFCSNPEILELLETLCIDLACLIVPGEAEPLACQEVPSTRPDEEEMARTIVQAHCLLCELCDSNREKFQSVIDAFAHDPA